MFATTMVVAMVTCVDKKDKPFILSPLDIRASVYHSCLVCLNH